MLALSLSAFAHPTPSEVRAEIVVDASHTGDGTLGVTMAWSGLPPGPRVFRTVGQEGQRIWTEVRFSNDAGPLKHHEESGSYTVDGSDGVTVSYDVALGGLGRHGHQGFVAADWAVFDGRIFLIPMGGVAPAEISVAFTLPAGWSAATPWESVEKGFVLRPSGVVGADQLLEGSCVGLGALTTQTAGTLRMAAPTAWADLDALFERTTKIHEWTARLGFDGPFTVVWTPEGPDEFGIYGGAYANGTCFQRPVEGLRNWQLLAHRYGHAMNRYPPTGMRLRDFRDSWFEEGLASWMEIHALAEVGITPDQAGWNILHRRHSRVRARNPLTHVALSDEPKVRDPAVVEYVHYTLAPLVVRLLEAKMQERSGVAMEDFVRHLYQRYGRLQAPLPLREEVESFTGDSYADFWALHVDRVTEVPPAWPEAVPSSLSLEPPVAVAAGRPVSRALLLSLATSGRYARYSDLRHDLVEGFVRLADLERRQVSLVPDAVMAAYPSLPGAQQAAILWTALEMPIDGLPKPPSRGCSGPDPLPEANFQPDPGTEVGAILTRLLAFEENQAWVKRGVDRVGVRLDSNDAVMPDVLAVPENTDLVLFTKWGSPPATAHFSLLDGSSVLLEKELVIDPNWQRTFTGFPGGSVGPGQRILTFRIADSEGVLVERSVWQFAP